MELKFFLYVHPMLVNPIVRFLRCSAYVLLAAGARYQIYHEGRWAGQSLFILEAFPCLYRGDRSCSMRNFATA